MNSIPPPALKPLRRACQAAPGRKARHPSREPLNPGVLLRVQPTESIIPRGYTLIEVLLTLAILMTLLTLVWPNLSRIFADHQLKSNVDKVRMNLATTRLQALNDSLAYQFRFEPAGQKYIVIPYELQDASATQSDASEAAWTPYHYYGQLPEDMRFEALNSSELVIERLSADWVSGLGSSEDLSDVSWSTPVLFFPDGTATDAEFQIVDSNSQLMRLAVRGLTGAVQISRVEMEDDR